MIRHSADSNYTLLCESEHCKNIFLNTIKQTFPISKKLLSWQRTAICVGIGAMK